MSLPDENARAFSIFLLWIYGGHRLKDPLVEVEDLYIFVNLYVMVEKWCCKELQEMAATIIYDWLHEFRIEDERDLMNVYTASQGSKIRSLFVRDITALIIVTKGELSGEWSRFHWILPLIQSNVELASDVAIRIAKFHNAKDSDEEWDILYIENTLDLGKDYYLAST